MNLNQLPQLNTDTLNELLATILSSPETREAAARELERDPVVFVLRRFSLSREQVQSIVTIPGPALKLLTCHVAHFLAVAERGQADLAVTHQSPKSATLKVDLFGENTKVKGVGGEFSTSGPDWDVSVGGTYDRETGNWSVGIGAGLRW